jgi:hypothetical protein
MPLADGAKTQEDHVGDKEDAERNSSEREDAEDVNGTCNEVRCADSEGNGAGDANGLGRDDGNHEGGVGNPHDYDDEMPDSGGDTEYEDGGDESGWDSDASSASTFHDPRDDDPKDLDYVDDGSDASSDD